MKKTWEGEVLGEIGNQKLNKRKIRYFSPKPKGDAVHKKSLHLVSCDNPKSLKKGPRLEVVRGPA